VFVIVVGSFRACWRTTLIGLKPDKQVGLQIGWLGFRGFTSPRFLGVRPSAFGPEPPLLTSGDNTSSDGGLPICYKPSTKLSTVASCPQLNRLEGGKFLPFFAM
jgi:hypothetical protein